MPSLRSVFLPLFLAGALIASAQRPARPNIIFAFADDWGRYASIYRDPARATPNDVIATPHFDALARGGLLFNDAHCSAPSCTPSRGAVFTGRHFYRNGSASQLHHPWPAGTPDPAVSLPGFLPLLEAAGYRVGVSYKTHVPPPLYGGRAAIHEPAGSLGGAYNRVARLLRDATDLAATREQINGEVRRNLATLIDSAAACSPRRWLSSPAILGSSGPATPSIARPTTGRRRPHPSVFERRVTCSLRFMHLPAILLLAAATAGGAALAAAEPVPFSRVQIDDAFWSPRIRRTQAITLPRLLDLAEPQGSSTTSGSPPAARRERPAPITRPTPMSTN